MNTSGQTCDSALLGAPPARAAGLDGRGGQMNALPPIGAPVVLRDDDGGIYSSRLEGEEDGIIAVARPSGLLAAVSYKDGMSFDLTWTMDNGIFIMPVTLVGSSTDGLVRLWHLEATGEIRAQQRRDYVRVPLTGRILLTPVVDDVRPGAAATAETPDGEADADIEGAFVDVSEVAAQCSVHLSMSDPRIAVGAHLRCRFKIAGDDFDIIGMQTILRPGMSPNETRIVVRFDHSEIAASALRRHVFRIQLESRRDRQQP